MTSLIFATRRIPKGSIKQWKDLIANIPKGWQICDGTNGTPDLRSRFPRGAPAATEAGTTGGSDTVTLDTTKIPSHNHGTTDPQHFHTFTQTTLVDLYVNTGLSGNTGSTSTATTGLSINNQGGGGSHNNKPAYYEVIYIMKMDDR